MDTPKAPAPPCPAGGGSPVPPDTHAAFAGLEPGALWKHFAALTRIPRPSGREQRAVAYVREWARSRSLDVRCDAVGNLCVRVPGSPGHEGAAPIVLQAHLDMVCERNADSPHDPEQGRIHVVRESEWLRSEGTTLGADNGIGIAAAMAVAEDDGLRHGPLELLMTLDEEAGMSGARGLDPTLLTGRTLINLDSEDDRLLFVGCAGGADLKLTFHARRSELSPQLQGLRLRVRGLQGGHSGIDIHRNRLNAIHALVRLLQQGAADTPLRLAAIDGGNQRNAIPREAVAMLGVNDASTFRDRIETATAVLREQFRGLDDGLDVVVEPAKTGPDAWSEVDSRRLLDLLRSTPSGVVAMSMDIPGLVETSTNLGVVRTRADGAEILVLARSSAAPALAGLVDTHRSLARLAGAEITHLGGYPGWKPRMDSRVLSVTRRTYARVFGCEPEVTAVHAGLECGLIGERAPGMDMVSFGPTLEGVHAPGERVHIASVGRFWRLLGAVLEDLAA
jgi:dipeptidase D